MTEVARPEPLVAADVDLSGYEYMPFYGEFLRRSHFNSRVTDGEFRAAVNLWWSAWKEIPAGSLPDDDAVLCRLADLARDRRTWLKVKSGAMAGFVLCSDNRWYHSFLSVLATASFEERKKLIFAGKKSGAVRREKKAKESAPEDEHCSNDVHPEASYTRTMFEQGKGEVKVKGKDNRFPGDNNIGDEESGKAVEAGNSTPIPEDAVARLLAELQRVNVPDLDQGRGIVERWARRGYTAAQVGRALHEVKLNGNAPTVAYVDPIVTRIANTDREIAAAAQARVDSTNQEITRMRSHAATATPPPPELLSRKRST